MCNLFTFAPFGRVSCIVKSWPFISPFSERTVDPDGNKKKNTETVYVTRTVYANTYAIRPCTTNGRSVMGFLTGYRFCRSSCFSLDRSGQHRLSDLDKKKTVSRDCHRVVETHSLCRGLCGYGKVPSFRETLNY